MLFRSNYAGSSQIQELIPVSTSDLFPIDKAELKLLHNFAEKNPIYYDSFEKTFDGIDCIVYEGDINKYWLNSIQHTSSCAPFSPTWILSGYIMTLFAKEYGYSQIIDIGSGDGRIAYCGKIIGLDSYSIELDEQLTDLQKSFIENINFNPYCSDATQFDYLSLNLTKPLFCIGGLAQMGGDVLATSIIEKISLIGNLRKSTAIVFAGTNSKRNLSNNQSEGGWSNLIQKYDLDVLLTLSLPTVWTFDQKIETPYIYTKFK